MSAKVNVENQIEQEMDNAGILSGKARRFFLYIICGNFSVLEIQSRTTITNIIRRYVDLLPKMVFPFYKSNRKLLTLPCDIILNEVLYTDRDLSMFFIKYARFCLLSEVLSEIYPSLFEFLTEPPYQVPAPHTVLRGEHALSIIKKYLDSRELADHRQDSLMITPEDRRLIGILNELSGCYYLPISSDFGPYNKMIFDAILHHSVRRARPPEKS